MNRRKLTLSIAMVALVAGTAALLAIVPQKLGKPGVKASAVAGSPRWQIYLPDRILGFNSTNQEVDAGVLGMLPPDTSFAEKIYYQPGVRPFISSVVLMGTDRTSIHKAEYCLTGQGMHIVQASRESVHMTDPQPYDLPVVKIVADDTRQVSGKVQTNSCVYVYWYVADGELSNDRSGMGRMWSMTKKLVFSGELQRWAYVRFYAFCDRGQEDATFETLKRAIVASVPQFQTTPAPGNTTPATHTLTQK